MKISKISITYSIHNIFPSDILTTTFLRNLVNIVSCYCHELNIETSLDGSVLVWVAFYEASKRRENKISVDHDTDLTLEIDGFFSQTIYERSKNLLESWNKLCFPKLAEAARIVLVIPGTAAPSERV